MNSKLILLAALLLSACNYMHVKPGTMEKDQIVYARRGGFSMERAIKESLEDRGYDVTVGTLRASGSINSDGEIAENINMNSVRIPSNVRYAIIVDERRERFVPYWCLFNGFWWWNFNVSIADQKTGEELLSWAGRGCANSSLRKLNDALDELERK